MSKHTSSFLGDLLELKRGYDLPKQLRSKGSVPIISSSGISDTHSEAKIKGPGIVTGRYGTIGEVFFCNEDFWPLNTTLYVRNFKGNNVRFIGYLLEAIDLKSLNAAGAVPGVNRNHLHKIKIRHPEKKYQTKIASILSAYDDLIENNLRRIKLLEELAQQTYEEWFVRMRFPGHETAEWDEETGLPVGWERNSLNSICVLHSGYPFKSKTFVENGEYQVITIKNVHRSSFRPEGSNTISKLPKNLKPHHFIAPGDILLSLTGNVGRVCLAHGKNGLLNQRVAKAEAIKPQDQPFLYSMLLSRIFEVTMENLANGAAQQNLSPIDLGKSKLTIPSKEIRSLYGDTIGESLSVSSKLIDQNRLLREARDLLLPRLMSGEVDIDGIRVPGFDDHV